MTLFKRILRKLYEHYYPLPKKSRILVLIDEENIRIDNTSVVGPHSHSMEDVYRSVVSQLAEIGRVVMSFIFVKTTNIMRMADKCHGLEIYPIVCPPVVRGKDSLVTKNIVDRMMMSFGQNLIGEVSSFTHLCIVSGDADFVPFAEWAKKQGLKVIIFSHSEKLSEELAQCADEDASGNRMVYFFLPKE